MRLYIDDDSVDPGLIRLLREQMADLVRQHRQQVEAALLALIAVRGATTPSTS